jgi:hypothetical protein
MIRCLGYYQRLPDVINAVVNVSNNNNSNAISSSNSNNNDNCRNTLEYIKWCEKNNPKHPDSCDCNWDEYQV